MTGSLSLLLVLVYERVVAVLTSLRLNPPRLGSSRDNAMWIRIAFTGHGTFMPERGELASQPV